MRILSLLCVLLAANLASADLFMWSQVPQLKDAQIVVFGEVHDNRAHHSNQAGLQRFAGKAVVYEMLTPAQAAMVTPELIADEAELEAALGWEAAGWPEFSMYYPIFAARPDVAVYGAAVPRSEARAAMETGVAQAFGAEAESFGLTKDLPPVQQKQREALQYAAHCDALPADLLPGMVAIQRLRDARLAQVALQALDETGGPVLVITGNGHARKDWGVPAVLETARPGLNVLSILQSEDGQLPEGGADLILDAPAPERDDPCAVFKK